MKFELPKTMKGVEMLGHGGAEMLGYREDIAVPEIEPNEVLIKVMAAGVNNTDINTRIGWYSKSDDSDDASWSGEALQFPRIQGADVCGFIVAVGNEVSADRIGERVLIEPCLTEVYGRDYHNHGISVRNAMVVLLNTPKWRRNTLMR